MVSHDGNLWIVFNGEIYNHVELARSSEPAGTFVARIRHRGVAPPLRAFGKECVHRLNGMFAFAIWDARERTLFAARDRLGIKPFFYHHTAHAAFASEVKALLARRSQPGRADHGRSPTTSSAAARWATKTGFAGRAPARAGPLA